MFFLWYICLMILYATKIHLVGVVQPYKCSKKNSHPTPRSKRKVKLSRTFHQIGRQMDRWEDAVVEGRHQKNPSHLKLYFSCMLLMYSKQHALSLNLLFNRIFINNFLFWFLFIMAKYSLYYSLYHIHLRKNFTSWFTFFFLCSLALLKSHFSSKVGLSESTYKYKKWFLILVPGNCAVSAFIVGMH